MKTYQIQEQFGIDNLVQVDVPEPAPGHGQVLVRMKAFSLNYRDLLVTKGQYNPRLRRPMVPLSDGAGEVVALGPGVDRFRVGDRVAGIFTQTWLAGAMTAADGRTALGGALDGVAADYVVFDQDGLVAVPTHLSFEEAATLPCAGVTAWNATMVAGGLRAGESVLVMGSGGVSVFALQLAHLAGARIVATSGSEEKLERLARLGAHLTINYKTTPDWDAPVRKATAGEGVDLVVEVGGAGTMARSLKAVRVGGRIVAIGVLAGPGDWSHLPLVMKGVSLHGILVGSRRMFEDLNRTLSLHGIHPVIDRVFAFGELREAMHAMETGAHFGKIVVRAGD